MEKLITSSYFQDSLYFGKRSGEDSILLTELQHTYLIIKISESAPKPASSVLSIFLRITRFVHQTIFLQSKFLRRIYAIQLPNLEKQGVIKPDGTLYKARHIHHLLTARWLLILLHCLSLAYRPEKHAVSQT